MVSNKANIDDAKQHLKDFADKKLHESTWNTAKESTMQIPDDDRYKHPKASDIQRK